MKFSSNSRDLLKTNRGKSVIYTYWLLKNSKYWGRNYDNVTVKKENDHFFEKDQSKHKFSFSHGTDIWKIATVVREWTKLSMENRNIAISTIKQVFFSWSIKFNLIVNGWVSTKSFNNTEIFKELLEKSNPYNFNIESLKDDVLITILSYIIDYQYKNGITKLFNAFVDRKYNELLDLDVFDEKKWYLVWCFDTHSIENVNQTIKIILNSESLQKQINAINNKTYWKKSRVYNELEKFIEVENWTELEINEIYNKLKLDKTFNNLSQKVYTSSPIAPKWWRKSNRKSKRRWSNAYAKKILSDIESISDAEAKFSEIHSEKRDGSWYW